MSKPRSQSSGKSKSNWKPLRESTFQYNEETDHINYLMRLAAYGDRPHNFPWFGIEYTGDELIYN